MMRMIRTLAVVACLAGIAACSDATGPVSCDPTADGFVSMRVDGDAFCATSVSYGHLPGDFGWLIGMDGRFRMVNLMFREVVGEHQVGSGEQFTGSWVEPGRGEFGVGSGSGSGTLHVTSVTADRIGGTFEFTALSEDRSASVRVTDGRFEARR